MTTAPHCPPALLPSLPTAITLALALLGTAAHAEDHASMFRFSGFGSLGVVHSTEDKADYIPRGEQATGAGYSHDWWAGADSRLGGQVDAKFGAGFSSAVQLTSALRADNSFSPEVSLAMLKWQATPSIAVRGGRLFIPVFPTSDYREVSYAQPWVRPPVEMYKSFVFQYFDGADITGTTSVGDVAVKGQAYFGKTKAKTPSGVQSSDRLYGLVVSADTGSSTYRGSYAVIEKLGTDSASLLGLFSLVRNGTPPGFFGPGSPATPGNPGVATEYQITGASSKYFSLGYTYDPGSWFAMAEVSLLRPFAFIPLTRAGYVTAGLRTGKFTPYATLARVLVDKPSSSTGSALIDRVRTGAANAGQSTLSLGLRWDVMTNVDLKLQIDHTKLDEGSSGRLGNTQPGFTPGASFQVFSAAVSFVF